MSRKSANNFGSLARPTTGDNQEEDDVDAEDGVLFYVNKGGFPVPTSTWERMWNHVAKIHTGGHKVFDEIRDKKVLSEVATPQAPLSLPPNMPTAEKLESIQAYMSALEYNHTGTQFFEIKKNRPISGLMDSAKEMIRESLPIKCLEAVILGLYLTNGMSGLERFPISFKTTFNGNTFRHVVLGVYSNGKYGALGMSRREDLMYKALRYKHLSDIVMDYEESYSKYWHNVKKIKFGLPIPHDSHSYETINWKFLSMNIPKMTKAEIIKTSDKFARDLKSQTKKYDAKASVYLSHMKPKPSGTPDVGASVKKTTVRTKQSTQGTEQKSNKKSFSKQDTSPKKEKKTETVIKETIATEEETNQRKKPDLPDNYQIRI